MSFVYPTLREADCPTLVEIGLDPEDNITKVAKDRINELLSWRLKTLTNPSCCRTISNFCEKFGCLAFPIFVISDISDEKPLPNNRCEALILKLKKPEHCLQILEDIKNLPSNDDTN